MARKPTSFDGFVGANAAGLLRTAYLITSDAQEAEDLVQECLLKVARRWRRVGAMDQPLAYARRVLVRLASRGSVGRSRRESELDLAGIEVGADSAALELFATRDELRAAVQQLAPRQRAVLVLRYFHDFSEAQVAEALGCTTGTVKSTTSRSLARLRELIEPAPVQTRSDEP